MTTHLSDMELDALRLGEANAEAAAHLSSCEACAARRDELANAAASFAADFDPVNLAVETIGRADPPAPWWRRWEIGLLLPVAAAAALMLIPEPTTRTKGDNPPIEVFVLEGETPKPMRGPVDPHARLAVRLDPGGAAFVRILWESTPDDRAALYPAQDGDAWMVNEKTWLAREVRLDGATTDERLIAVLCEAPFTHERALAIAAGDAAKRCRQFAVPVTKR